MKIRITGILFLLISIGCIAFITRSEVEAGAVIPGQYIVVFNDATNADELEDRLVGRAHAERLASYRSVIKGFSARMSAADAAQLAADPSVAFVSEDRVVSIADARDELRGSEVRSDVSLTATRRSDVTIAANTQTIPTGVNRINAENKTNTGVGVNVAVIDTGILTTHPDLVGVVVGGKSCVLGQSNYVDQNGHGTHVAGTIAALNNTQGVVGVAPGAKLWAVRVLDRWGNGSWSTIICGLDFVTSKAPANGGPIKIANLSLGGGGTNDNNCGKTNNDALHKAICRARDSGVTIVAAAGNSGANTSGFVPAAYDDAVIAVSALADSDGILGSLGGSTGYGPDDTFATFSNYGASVDIGAPGTLINSTWLSNTYKAVSGTSMSSPHVAGAAALYIATHPSALWGEVKSALQAAAETLGNGHTDPSGKHSEVVLRADSL